MLNEMRFGRLSQKSIAMFKSLSRPIMYDDGLAATELYTHNLICTLVKADICHLDSLGVKM